jgi:predicted esterase
MYGTLMAAADRRVSVVAFQAMAGSFGDWMLYNQAKLTPEAKQAVIDRLAPLAPLLHIHRLPEQMPVLLQFANMDFYVPKEKAQALFDAAQGRKSILWYESGHGLNDQAFEDRKRWLLVQLGL